MWREKRKVKRKRRKKNSRKSVRWSAVPVAPLFVYVSVMVRGAAAPKGPMTYAALKIERARGPEARKLAVGPANLTSCGPDGPAAILLGILESFFYPPYILQQY